MKDLATLMRAQIEAHPLLRNATEIAKQGLIDSATRSIERASRKQIHDEKVLRHRSEMWRRSKRAFGLYLQGLSYRRIGIMINRTPSAVSEVAKRYLRGQQRHLRRNGIEGEGWQARITSYCPSCYRIKCKT